MSRAGDELFDDPVALAIVARVRRHLAELGDVEERPGRSQIGFRHGRVFAMLWPPGRYVRSDVPAVLTVVLPERAGSTRFKEVLQPAGRDWVHHLELRSADEVDDEVRAWLSAAWRSAAEPRDHGR